MTRHIIFVTGNTRKISEAETTLVEYGISITPVAVDMDEIQHHNPVAITKAKARAAYASLMKPVVVSDTSWSIPALGGFPGGYMKDVSAWLQPSDWLALMSHHNDRQIICMEHIAYYDGRVLKHFESQYEGVIIREARGRDADNESIEKVTILYGDKTMAQQLADGGIASAGEDLYHWKQFGEWYSRSI